MDAFDRSFVWTHTIRLRLYIKITIKGQDDRLHRQSKCCNRASHTNLDLRVSLFRGSFSLISNVFLSTIPKYRKFSTYSLPLTEVRVLGWNKTCPISIVIEGAKHLETVNLAFKSSNKNIGVYCKSCHRIFIRHLTLQPLKSGNHSVSSYSTTTPWNIKVVKRKKLSTNVKCFDC